MISKALVKENNGGVVSIECYDESGDIAAVVCGVEQGGQNTGLSDLIGIVDGELCSWSYRDASQWYDTDGNSMGDRTEDGKELTAQDAKDDSDETNIIAEYDGNTAKIYTDSMGSAGKKYFGL